jgi:hypothetical protein
MDTDLLNYPLFVTVLLKKTARVHDTITRESDATEPLVVDVLAGLFSHQWERVATPTIYTRPRENTATRVTTPVELMMKHERSRPKGVGGKVDVLDELQIILCKRLTTVRRYGWL